MCERFFLPSILDTSQMNESSNEKELFESSKKENFFLESSKPDEHNFSDTSSNLNLNSSSYSQMNSSTELYDFSNISFNDIIQNNPNVNNNTKTIAEAKDENIFLGKKRKIHFDVIKNSHKKPFFFTYNINSIPSNNSNKECNNILNSQNSSNEEKEKNDASEKDHPNGKRVKLFNTYIELDDNCPKENLKEGKWSYDEHIKFIIAYVNYRKRYELIDKFISSRNIIQIRSHAQKFFKKLKQMQNNEYDFSSDEIKNLFDIIDIIEDNNKTNMNNKEYAIKTLISFSENNSKEGENNLGKENKYEKNGNIIIKDKEENTLEELFLDNKRNINMENIIYENEVINKGNIFSKDIHLNNIIENEQNKEAQVQKNYFDYNCIDNMLNNKYNDDNVFLSGDLDFFCPNEISSRANNNRLYKIRKSHYFNFISNYFCCYKDIFVPFL